MLTIYRRHRNDCPRRNDAEIRTPVEDGLFVRRAERRCSCTLWAHGFVGNGPVRKSLKTLDWQTAVATARELRKPGSFAIDDEPVSIETAEQEFLADCTARKLKTASIDRYRILFRQLNAFAADRGLRFLTQLETPVLNKFRATWKGKSALSDLNKLERMRCFFKFAVASGYVRQNPAAVMRNPKIRPNPTLPFSQDEMLKISAASGKRIADAKPAAKNKARRLRGLVLLLRYSGLRISDAVGCEADRLLDGKLFLYTQKTGQHVYCPLPAFVVKELERLPLMSDRYWFHTGASTVETARKKWSEQLTKLFKSAGITHGHAHRFRDTFAVELLKASTPIERVSILLGHSSVKVTERHYNPWNRARQEQVEADVARSWAGDPVVIFERGTRA